MQLQRSFCVQAIAWCAVFLFGFLSQAHAGEFPVSGSYLFVRDKGQPVEETVSFSALVVGDYYLLRIYNGPGDDDPVTSARILVNGSELLFPSDFNPKVEFLEVPVSLQLQNTLTVQLGGKPGSALGAEVVGVDSENPSISAAVSPEANGAGWHKADVTITFTCDDALSGVESCSESVLVSEEGADQLVTGSAMDKAGNSAETQVSISLDKTPPQLTNEIIPPANSAGWHREVPTISYQCQDNLSGIASCPEQQQVSEEGADQLIAANAVDIAGNAAEIQSTVSLDLTPPEVATTISPEANAAGWHNALVTVSYQCSDNLSGMAACPEAQTLANDGASQQVAGTAVDLADNSAETLVTVSLDQTPPQLTAEITPPANSAGWHREAVAISYLCEDALSGVATCPDARSISEEGANQVINASAADIAGNTAVRQNVVQLDLTPPDVNVDVSPPANAADWHNAPVTVSYQCSDSLSGIASCPESQTFSGDGEGQVVSGSAEDLAGNNATTEVSFNLDQTPPEISFVSPARGSLVREPQPQIKLLLSDNLALDSDSLSVSVTGTAITGCTISANIALCEMPQPLPTNAEVDLSASVRDLAGNTGEAGITTAVDTDGDTVADYIDQCPDTASSQSANAQGCALTQLDSDSDGVSDADEIAAGTDPEDAASFPQVTIETFAASPASIDGKGEQVQLRWRVAGASAVSIDNDIGGQPIDGLGSEGSVAIEQKMTTRYTLTASGPGGSLSREIEVKLNLSPPPDLWTSPNVPVEEQIATSLAVAEDGSAYVGAFDGNFYKVNASGQVEWVLENAGLVMGKAAIGEGRIIFGANISGSGRMEQSGKVYALGPDKALLWDFETEGAVVAGPILSVNRDTAYIATYSGHIYALDVQNGNEHWKYQLPGEQRITAVPALSGEKLVVHTENNKIFALDSSSDEAGERVLWMKDLMLGH